MFGRDALLGRRSLYLGGHLPITEAGADANSFVVEMQATSNGENETGAGLGLSGTDLVLTQVGTIPAASSGWRTLNGSSQYFTFPSQLSAAFFQDTTWCILMHVKDLERTNVDRLIAMLNSSTYYGITLKVDASLRLFCEVANSGAPTWHDNYTSDSLQASTEYWIAAWADGINPVRFGFKAGGDTDQPTGWDSFDSTKRAEISGFNGNMSSVVTNINHVFAYNGSLTQGGKIKSITFSKDAIK